MGMWVLRPKLKHVTNYGQDATGWPETCAMTEMNLMLNRMTIPKLWLKKIAAS
jgi:hypothetical protein